MLDAVNMVCLALTAGKALLARRPSGLLLSVGRQAPVVRAGDGRFAINAGRFVWVYEDAWPAACRFVDLAGYEVAAVAALKHGGEAVPLPMPEFDAYTLEFLYPVVVAVQRGLELRWDFGGAVIGAGPVGDGDFALEIDGHHVFEWDAYEVACRIYALVGWQQASMAAWRVLSRSAPPAIVRAVSDFAARC